MVYARGEGDSVPVGVFVDNGFVYDWAKGAFDTDAGTDGANLSCRDTWVDIIFIAHGIHGVHGIC